MCFDRYSSGGGIAPTVKTVGQGGCHLASWLVFLAGAGAPTVKTVGQVGSCSDSGQF